jgi:tRNA(adenine34) deaminase
MGFTAGEAVQLAVAVAEEGLAEGEMPIGAVVTSGDDVLGRSFTRERSLGRRIVHADLLALTAGDETLGFRRVAELTLAVNLEPCLMCLGAAVTLGVERVFFGIESPDDGGVATLQMWRPRHELPFFRPPREISGGHHERKIRDQFERYAHGDGPPGMRLWAADLSDPTR